MHPCVCEQAAHVALASPPLTFAKCGKADAPSIRCR